MSQPVGRFAPTPSGRLHLGNILCAMLAWLSMRSQGGRFLLRIEDVDIPRCPRSAGRQIIEDLTFLGFDWDEEPLWQSDRGDFYESILRTLEEKGALYPCFCTRAQLHATQAPNLGDTQYVYPGTCRSLTAAQREALAAQRNPAMRLQVPDRVISFVDGLQGEYAENLARDCGDFVLRRTDGLFGYQLAVVADDAFSGVTEVVRGRDILSATPRQIWLQHLLGYETPHYIHIPLLTDAEGRRLAKRDRDTNLTELAQTSSPEAILGRLACAAGLQAEPRPASLYDLVKDFSWKKVSPTDLRLPR